MSTSDAVKAELFWPRLEAVFGRPKEPERAKALAREFTRLFQRVPADRVTDIVTTIIDEHEGPGWPKPAAVKRVISRHLPTAAPDTISSTVQNGPDAPFHRGQRVRVVAEKSVNHNREGVVLRTQRFQHGTKHRVEVELDRGENPIGEVWWFQDSNCLRAI